MDKITPYQKMVNEIGEEKAREEMKRRRSLAKKKSWDSVSEEKLREIRSMGGKARWKLDADKKAE